MDSPQQKQPLSAPSATHGDIAQVGPGEAVISVWPQPARKGGGLYLRLGKRIVDTLGALAGLAVTSPALLACAVAVRLDSPGPIFYRQWRVGQFGRTFQIFKFRTMFDGADKHGSKVTAFGDARITRVGKILRKTKLDEIPQLLNVVRGEMSLVGPRPEVPEYTEKYTSKERGVLEVRPGITGPASLAYIDEGRILATAADREKFYVNTIMRRKLRFDLAYCRKVCLLGDARIIIRTGGSLVGLRFSRHREGPRASRATNRS
jgi:lipopolysaccharide/colanic/teichoic acid biosynthesis glycosyltransferase